MTDHPLARFRRSVAVTLRHEGGFVNHPRDPGGPTNMGITQRTLSAHLGREATLEDVQSLDRSTAEQIYRRDYWNAVQGDALPPGLDLVTFDAAVNSGPRRAARWTQRALRKVGLPLVEDGTIGRETAEAARAAHRNRRSVDAIKKACAARLGFLRGLATFDAFGRGWTRRVSEIEAKATRWAIEDQGRDAAPILRHEAEHSARQADRNRLAAQGSAAATPTGAGALDATADPSALVLALAVTVGIAAVVFFSARLLHLRERRRAFSREAQETRK